ncbi:MAG: hypothetical protein MZV70_10675 [Desulfobacterales bacterium]|nr:hypothetical protein [Desulfobacterales bacterium]
MSRAQWEINPSMNEISFFVPCTVKHLHNGFVGRVAVFAVEGFRDTPEGCTAPIIERIWGDGAQEIVPDILRDIFENIVT